MPADIDAMVIGIHEGAHQLLAQELPGKTYLVTLVVVDADTGEVTVNGCVPIAAMQTIFASDEAQTAAHGLH